MVNKIEAVGTPLKDWNVDIFRGVLTGYNDAFIISSEKRDEILAKCSDESERQRTAAIIRPILRGRDIKRYGYVFAEQYLIATFPAKQYDIDNYPALKDYLLAIGIERLEQTGEEHIKPYEDKAIKDALKSGDEERFERLITRDGSRHAAISSTLLTQYDSKGRIIQIDPSDENLILHGTKRTNRS